MNIGAEVYVVLVLVVILIAAMKYDDRRRAKYDAGGDDHKSPE